MRLLLEEEDGWAQTRCERFGKEIYLAHAGNQTSIHPSIHLFVRPSPWRDSPMRPDPFFPGFFIAFVGTRQNSLNGYSTSRKAHETTNSPHKRDCFSVQVADSCTYTAQPLRSATPEGSCSIETCSGRNTATAGRYDGLFVVPELTTFAYG